MDIKKGDRISWIDVARGIGIFLIVFGHTSGGGFLTQVLYAFHVPLFFFLTGTVYRKKQSLKTFFLTKIKRLLIPYWVWGIVSILIFIPANYLLHMVGDDIGFIKNLFGLIYANSRNGLMTWNRPLWFLPCLFLSLSIVEVLESWILYRKESTNCKRVFIICCFLFVGIVWNKAANWILPFQLESAIAMVAFIEAGISFSECDCGVKISSLLFEAKIILLIVCVIVGVGLSYLNGYTDARVCSYGRIPVIYIATSFLLGTAVILLANLINHNKSLELLGRNSLSILLMHKFPILGFQKVIPFTKQILNNDSPDSITRMLTTLLVSLICIFLCLIISKVIAMFLPECLGQTRKKNKVLAKV